MQKKAKSGSADGIEEEDFLFSAGVINQPYVVGEDVYEKIVRGIDLKNKELIRVSFKQCIFRNCDFSGDSFESCKLDNCLFIECDFTGAEFSDTSINSCIFEDCKVEQLVSKDKTCLVECDFKGCDGSIELVGETVLTSVDFMNCDLKGSVFGDCFLAEVEFADCDLSHTEVAPEFGCYELTLDFCCLKETYFGKGDIVGKIVENNCYIENREENNSTYKGADDYLSYYYDQLYGSYKGSRRVENRSLNFYCSDEQLIKEVLSNEHICPLQQVGFIFG